MKKENETIRVIRGFLRRFNEDHVGAYAAQSAYFILLSFIPFVLLLVTLGRMIHGRTASVLQALGKRSFDFYLFQQPFFGSVFGTVLFSILGVPALLSVLGSFLLSLGAGWMISRMLDRTKHLKKLFGR